MGIGSTLLRSCVPRAHRVGETTRGQAARVILVAGGCKPVNKKRSQLFERDESAGSCCFLRFLAERVFTWRSIREHSLPSPGVICQRVSGLVDRLPSLPPSELPLSLYSRASGMRDYSCATVGGPSSVDIITRNQRGSFIRLSTWVVERDDARARERSSVGSGGCFVKTLLGVVSSRSTIDRIEQRRASEPWRIEGRGFCWRARRENRSAGISLLTSVDQHSSSRASRDGSC